VVVAKIAELLAGKRAGLFAAAALALNAALTYYGVATNLDGPSIFWAVLALYFFMRLIALQELHAIRWGMLCVAAAVATKDQAYAVFALALPAGLALWLVTDAWPRANLRRILLAILLWGGIALVALLLIDGAITNPRGFADRIAFLTGPASQDYVQYEASPAGWAALLADMFNFSERYYPSVFFLFALAGIARVAYRFHLKPGVTAAGFLPLLAALSFTLAFNFVALRSEPRFLLPQSVFLAVYIGIAVDGLAHLSKRWPRIGLQLLCAVVACLGFARCAGISTAFLADPRYDAERWMAAHMRPGDTVEIYGLNAYLPRFPAGVVVTRVGPKPLKARNPLPGVTERREPYGVIGQRQPRFLVVPGTWVAVYLNGESHLVGRGRIVQKGLGTSQLDVDARNYFGALFAGRFPYRLTHKSAYAEPLGPSGNAYESLTQPLFVFERKPKEGI
jgi:4-amino-4-deoxy-L-arabinose transferase-like glycosyltransferase